MGCNNCNKNKSKVGTVGSVPTKQHIRDLIAKIKKERIKKDN